MTLLNNEIFYTILARPYVFAFLGAYLVLSISSWGWRRSAAFLLGGYAIAWVSEASSIRTGFPYGQYSYVAENLRGEWLNAGVPVWDSLSYVFLCYAGLELARFVLSFDRSIVRTYGRTHLALLAALFVVILDIVVDPLANMGERWFLGKIYFYPEPGFYFGVPFSNFAGWFLVSFAIVGSHLLLCGTKDFTRRLAPPLFYFSIFLFNWVITLTLREWALALLDLVWISVPTVLFTNALRKPLKS